MSCGGDCQVMPIELVLRLVVDVIIGLLGTTGKMKKYKI